MAQKYAAIPTKYAGVQFRSRLEARWAAFFDLMSWKWEYEPIELAGYIPDFLINGYDGGKIQMLVEVKPASTFAELAPAAVKIRDSGWDGVAVVVGQNPRIAAWNVYSDTLEVSDNLMVLPRTRRSMGVYYFLSFDEDDAWNEAGAITQYKGSRSRSKK